jgi:hypothetical protein
MVIHKILFVLTIIIGLGLFLFAGKIIDSIPELKAWIIRLRILGIIIAAIAAYLLLSTW